MPVGIIVAFVVVFALIMFAVSVGLKFFDARRKRLRRDPDGNALHVDFTDPGAEARISFTHCGEAVVRFLS